MPRRKPGPKPEGKIEKAEDKIWHEWFDKLDVKEHEQKLKQLGLDKEDIEEWEEAEGIQKTPKKKKK